MRSLQHSALQGMALLLFCCLPAAASDNEKIFPEQRCRLVLPGNDFQWVLIPPNTLQQTEAAAVFESNSGLAVSFIVVRAPQGISIGPKLIEEYDAENKQSGCTKISGTIIQFRDIPCYQFHFQAPQYRSIVTGRIFVAYGYVYQLWIAGSDLPIEQRDQLDPLFNSFEFTSPPLLPKSPTETMNSSLPGYTLEVHNTSILIIKIGLYILIAAGIIYAIKRFIRPTPARPSPQTPSPNLPPKGPTPTPPSSSEAERPN